MARIPEQFIQEIISRVDLLQLVQRYFPLKKTGINYTACCPFHQEKSPSFTVNPAKHYFHCFGCGEHGDALSFLSKIENLNFIEALEKLASEQGMSLPQSHNNAHTDENAAIYKIMERAKRYYELQLRQHPASKEAINYLKSRGLTGEIAKQFSIGFAPPGWSNLIKALNNEEVQTLMQAGLILKSESGRVYDRFRHRIMFPILDRKGRTIAFGARAMGDELPKYLNSPETPLFHKGRQFYGLYAALETRRAWQALIIVEGYLDVIALTQFQVFGVVATLGTALTEHHIQMLFKYSQELIFCFDGDRAGQRAAEKALDTILPEMKPGREVTFVFLPENHDPDSFIRANGKDGFQLLIKAGDNLADFFLKKSLKQASEASLSKKAAMIETAQNQLKRLPQSLYRTLIETRLNEMIPLKQGNDLTHKQVEAPGLISPAIKAALMLIRYPSLYKQFLQVDECLSFTVEGMVMLRYVVNHLKENLCSSEDLLSLCKTNGIVIAKYDKYMQAISQFSEEDKIAELSGAINRIIEIDRQYLVDKLLIKSKKTELSEVEKATLKDLINNRKSN